jgi:hypothetical protein
MVLRKKIFTAFALLLLSGAALAQIPTAGNFYLGYSLNHGNTGFSDNGTLHGWEGALQGNFAPYVGMVADVSAQYGHLSVPAYDVNPSTHVVSYLFGPRVMVSVGKYSPFAHVLVGASHLSVGSSVYSHSETAFGAAYGGGLDYKLVPAVAWRFQLDDLQTRFHSSHQNNARFSTGVVIHF